MVLAVSCQTGQLHAAHEAVLDPIQSKDVMPVTDHAASQSTALERPMSTTPQSTR